MFTWFGKCALLVFICPNVAACISYHSRLEAAMLREAAVNEEAAAYKVTNIYKWYEDVRRDFERRKDERSTDLFCKCSTIFCE
jgi:hypothetical protein